MAKRVIYPGHFKTLQYSEFERFVRQGSRDIVMCFCGRGRPVRVEVMHRLGDRVLFFDPVRNPGKTYDVAAGEIGAIGTGGGLPPRRYEGHGLHSVELAAIRRAFHTGKAHAMIPRACLYAM